MIVFASSSKYFTTRSSSTATKLIDKYSYDVIFIDEDIYNDESHAEDKSEWLDELYTKAAIKRPNAIYVLLVDEKSYLKNKLVK